MNRRLEPTWNQDITTTYEAPAIDGVFDTSDLEREILYAGTFTGPPWSNIPD